jgi:hypothetical protein
MRNLERFTAPVLGSMLLACFAARTAGQTVQSEPSPFSGPRGSVQKRPTGVRSKPANGSGPELLEVVPDRELSKQGKSGLFPQSSPKNAFRSPQPRFLEVVHGSSHGFSGAEGSVCDLVLQLRGPHLRM